MLDHWFSPPGVHLILSIRYGLIEFDCFVVTRFPVHRESFQTPGNHTNRSNRVDEIGRTTLRGLERIDEWSTYPTSGYHSCYLVYLQMKSILPSYREGGGSRPSFRTP